MALDKLFCLSKSSRKSAAHHQSINRQNEAIQQAENNNHHRPHHTNNNNSGNNNSSSSNNNNNTSNNNTLNATTNIPCRYVTTEFHAVEQDELTVYPGDVVLYEFSDVEDGKNWSHVLSLTKNVRGFVPSDILSIEPKRFTQCIKKKLPRSLADPTNDHHHQHGGAHSHKTHCTSERTCHSNGGSIKLQKPHHLRVDRTPHFGLAANSCQGSSGCQTFQKYPDFPHFNPPSYDNLSSTHAGLQCGDCRPFHVLHSYGDYMVMHNFVAREENDLEVKPGDIVAVLNKDDDDWYWVQRGDKREGFVPARFICPYEQVQSVLNKGNSTVTMKSSNQIDFHTYINHRPGGESLPTDQQSSVFPG